MVQFNFNERTIKAKVVYYGPAQSGKTTNLEQIHRITDPSGTNRLISLNTAHDRTLFFDLLPFSLGTISGYDFEVQLYTVPGQVQYNATRRVVLAGADAVVFVADSRQSVLKENVAALENMKVNLLANRLVPEKLPLVFQYNKRDLPELVAGAELDKTLNAWGCPSYQAIAPSGEGVMETFIAVVQEMLSSIAVKYNLKEKGLDPAGIPELVVQAFASVLGSLPRRAPAPSGRRSASPSRVVVAQMTDSLHAIAPAASAQGGVVSEELLQRSIRSSVHLAESLAALVREMNLGLSDILLQGVRLQSDREDAVAKRAAVARICGEAQRLKALLQQVGQAADPLSAGDEAPSAPASPAGPVSPAEPLPAAAEAATGLPEGGLFPEGDLFSSLAVGPPPVPEPARPAAPGFDAVLRLVLGDVGDLLDGHGLQVQLNIEPGIPPPRCPPHDLHHALSRLLEGVADVSPPRLPIGLRCERKAVLIRGPAGETRQDFLMLAVAHHGWISPDDQQRIIQGEADGALGEAGRLCREMGGFVRFAPLGEGALETRFFLPT
jgi:signal recognition particle receptor subunit beta